MILGAALVELRVHGSRSLKEKRGVLQSIKQRLRNRFNLSVAEVGGQETWQRAVLALAVAGSQDRGVRRELERAIEFVEELHLAEVTASEIELLTLPQEPGWVELDDEEPSADGAGD
jgi:uncharacterized protein YlxP (DUF503 family)